MAMTTKNETDLSQAMIQRIQDRLAVAATGASQLLALRSALHHAVATLGIRVEFTPESDADLVDYIGLGAFGALTSGIGGAALGLSIGALVEEPLAGLVFGGLLGALLGAQAGVVAVKRGWRLRILRLPTGAPSALLEPIRANDGLHS
jgi:hypothetical protein